MNKFRSGDGNRSAQPVARSQSNDEEKVMSLRINSEAPNFTVETTQGKINFH
jgi:hypothetical protein